MDTTATRPLPVISRRALLATAAVAVPALMLGVQPAPAGAVVLGTLPGTVTAAGGLNLRTGPGAGYRAIRTLANGTRLAITETSGDWFKVTVAGIAGWVSSWYVTLAGAPSRAIYRGNTSRKMVALTFDAGSDLGYTEWIMNTFIAHRVPATFGLTGAWVRSYPDYARWMVNSGFQILNHTVNHPSFTGYSDPSGPISPARRLTELVANESRLRSFCGGAGKPYWRPPFGDIDTGVLRDSGTAGFSRTVMWTVDSLGWKAGVTADQIVTNVVAKAGWGMISLMHVGAASQDAYALERVIHWFRDRGYAFGTVAQVIA